MAALSTEWSRSLALQAPIVNAPMGGVAGGALAAAVSRAGGLGMVGMGSAGTPEQLERELGHLSGLDRPFGIGLVDWVVQARPRLLDAALAARPALLAVSFGDDFTWVRRARDSAVLTAAQVGDLQGARRAVDAGVEVVIARGAEGGGHGEPRVGTLPLLVEVLEEVPVPVLAAGGISSGRALAAVLAAGAAGAWVGTAFEACTEGSASEHTRRALLAARDTDTEITRAFDIAQGYPWPERYPERVLRDGLTDPGADGPRGEPAPVNAGQGVGLLTSVRAAADVVAEMCAEARRLLDAW